MDYKFSALNEIDRQINIFNDDNISHNVYNYMELIDITLASYYHKMGLNYYNQNGEGKFCYYCNKINLQNDELIFQDLQKTSDQSLLVQFDNQFPFRYDIKHNNQKLTEIKNILLSFMKFGDLFLDSFFATKHYNLFEEQDRTYITYGYIRNSSKLYIPNEIVKLIEIFWCDLHVWTFKDTNLKAFLQTKKGARLKHDPLRIHGINISAQIYPNGRKHKNHVIFFLTAKRSPDIKSVVLHFQLKCIQANCYYQKTAKWAGNRHAGAKGWGENALQLSQCANYNRLDFLYTVDVLHIEYTTEEQNYFKPVEMSCYSQCKWNISKCDIDSIVNTVDTYKRYLFGLSFDNGCWGLLLNTVSVELDQTLRIIIALYQLPPKIHGLEVNAMINIEPDILFEEKIARIQYNEVGGSQIVFETCYDLNGIKDLIEKLDDNDSSVCISCCIRVIKGFDVEQQEISKQKLKSEYNFK